jgi:NADP-dependent 3-hydroxy acid dehydrogenase YdfG
MNAKMRFQNKVAVVTGGGSGIGKESEQASWITGIVLPVDGGVTAGRL